MNSQENDFLAQCPGSVGDLARAISKSISAFRLPMISLGAAFSAMAALRSGYYRWNGIDTHAYHVIIARAGLGKTNAQKCIEQTMHECSEDRLLTSDSTSERALMRELKDYPRRLIMLDEIGRMFEQVALDKGGYRQEMMSSLLKLYSCNNSQASTKNYSKDEKIVVDRPLVSIFGASTPHSFFAGMTPRLAFDGMISRVFLWFEGGADQERLGRSQFIVPPSLIDEVSGYANGPKQPGNLQLIEPIEMINPNLPLTIETLDRLVHSKTDTLESAIYARRSEQLIKICLCLCSPSGLLSDNDREYAEELTKYLIDRCLETCSEHLGQTDFDIRANSLAGQILAFIDQECPNYADQFIAASIVCRKFQKGKARDLAIQELLDQERIFARRGNGRAKWYTSIRPEDPEDLPTI